MHNTPKRWVLGVLYYLLIYPQKDTGFKKWFNLDLNIYTNLATNE